MNALNPYIFVLLIFLFATSAQADCSDILSDKKLKKELGDVLSRISQVKTASELANENNYPVKLNVKRKKLRIGSKDKFIKSYKKFFNRKAVGLFKEAQLKNIFCNSQGIMFADGFIWLREFDGQYKIITYNIPR